MKRIEFGELRIGTLARDHIKDCLDRNWISMGPKVELLEKEFAMIMGTRYAVATSSGTSSIVAMTLALPELCKRKVVRGKSNILCPALGFIANSSAIVSGRLIPRPIEIKCEDLNIDENLVEESIDDNTVAIYAIGTMGCPSNMDKLKDIADRYDLILFEDGCENYGSKINGEFSHKRAIAGCSSLYTAHLVVASEGSLIYTDSEVLRDLLKSIRSHGRHPDSQFFDHIRFGSNFKMTDLAASIGLEGVAKFHENIALRKRNWQSLVDFTEQFKDRAWFSNEPDGVEVMPHGFSITIKPDSGLDINNLIRILDEANIHWKKNFGAIYTHPAMSEFKYKDCPKAEWCGNNGIHVGVHRYLEEEDITRICKSIQEFFN